MKIKECKAIARKTLIGRYGTLIFAGILAGLILMIFSAAVAGCAGFTLYHAGLLNSRLDRNVPFSLPLVSIGVVAFLAMLLLTWIISIWLDLGKKKLMLNICRGRKYGVGDIFYGFRAGSRPWNYLLAGLIFLIILLVFSLLPVILGFCVPRIPGINARTAKWAVIGIDAVIVLLALYVFTSFLFVTLILTDKPETGLSRAFSKSRELMKGRRIRGFWLITFSFLFWYLLIGVCRFTSLWVLPYIECAMCVFYLDADGSIWQIPDPDYPAVQTAAAAPAPGAASAPVIPESTAPEALAENVPVTEAVQDVYPAADVTGEDSIPQQDVSDSIPEAEVIGTEAAELRPEAFAEASYEAEEAVLPELREETAPDALAETQTELPEMNENSADQTENTGE